jgi:1,2-diacylglycerol 3-alpha-glucosyltransferase/glucuronosyltransferase
MKILVVTDAWHPQVNGVVRTLTHLAEEAATLDAKIEFLTPDLFWNLPLPSYPEIRLAVPCGSTMARYVAGIAPDAIHVATEGPLGHAMRHYCLARRLPFTTSFHTRFPDYLAERLPLPPAWTCDWTWAWLRWFHAAGAATLAATPSLAQELAARGFSNVKRWSRGVDAALFYPRADSDLGLPRPVFLNVGRLAVEKNIEAFLSLDLPGTKVVVGSGPAGETLMRRYPQAVFLGQRQGEELACIYAAADVFVFPSRTETFGLVLLEALASGLPVAAFPAAAPCDVIGKAPVAALNADLRTACFEALKLSRQTCRDFALGMTWQASAQAFLNVVQTSQTAQPVPRAA